MSRSNSYNVLERLILAIIVYFEMTKNYYELTKGLLWSLWKQYVINSRGGGALP